MYRRHKQESVFPLSPPLQPWSFIQACALPFRSLHSKSYRHNSKKLIGFKSENQKCSCTHLNLEVTVPVPHLGVEKPKDKTPCLLRNKLRFSPLQDQESQKRGKAGEDGPVKRPKVYFPECYLLGQDPQDRLILLASHCMFILLFERLSWVIVVSWLKIAIDSSEKATQVIVM